MTPTTETTFLLNTGMSRASKDVSIGAQFLEALVVEGVGSQRQLIFYALLVLEKFKPVIGISGQGDLRPAVLHFRQG